MHTVADQGQALSVLARVFVHPGLLFEVCFQKHGRTCLEVIGTLVGGFPVNCNLHEVRVFLLTAVRSPIAMIDGDAEGADGHSASGGFEAW